MIHAHMYDIKNFIISAVASSTPFAFLQDTAPVVEQAAKGVILSVALFALGKAVDVAFQYYKLRREERRVTRESK